LGTGLGGLAQSVKKFSELPYQKIPHFPRPTVEGHQGSLVFGELGGKKVVCLMGRVHYYEGYSAQETALPIRALKALGIKVLILTNAAGGLNHRFKVGDLMAITDHINLMGDNPLRGPNDETWGPRFPSMIDCYDPKLLALAFQVAKEYKIDLKKGVYAALMGPSLETRAEYRFLAGIGADAVGMSTVPEVIAARHLGLRVLGLSVITNLGFSDTAEFQPVRDVLTVAEQVRPVMKVLIEKIIERMEN
jgi:purine-nucleoside phosphorylase